MRTYAAMLRGVNVSGHNIVKMAELRQVVESMGVECVKTYLQSGNLAFRAAGSPTHWAEKLEKMISQKFGVDTAVFARSLEEMRRITVQNPFPGEIEAAPARLHVVFLGASAPRAGLKRLAAIQTGEDKFESRGKEIYLYCPNGYGRTKLSNSAIEKAFSAPATTRNWNTVTKLLALAESLS